MENTSKLTDFYKPVNSTITGHVKSPGGNKKSLARTSCQIETKKTNSLLIKSTMSSPQKRKIPSNGDNGSPKIRKKSNEKIQTTISFKINKKSGSSKSSKVTNSNVPEQIIPTDLQHKAATENNSKSSLNVYRFQLEKRHHILVDGAKMFICDVCKCVYKKSFSLRRHYLRTHINCIYLSTSDLTNSCIDVTQQTQHINNAQKQQSSGFNNFSMCNRSPKSSQDKKQGDKHDTMFPGLYKCDQCYVVFDHTQELIAHRKQHDSIIAKSKPGRPPICNGNLILVSVQESLSNGALENFTQVFTKTSNSQKAKLPIKKSVHSPKKQSPARSQKKDSPKKGSSRTTLRSNKALPLSPSKNKAKLISVKKAELKKKTSESPIQGKMHKRSPSVNGINQTTRYQRSPSKDTNRISRRTSPTTASGGSPRTSPTKTSERSPRKSPTKTSEGSPRKSTKASEGSPRKSPTKTIGGSPRTSPTKASGGTPNAKSKSPIKKKVKARGSKYMKRELKKYPCSKCRVKFSRQSSLERHTQEHNENKTYPCSICGKKFMNETKVRQHARYHFSQNVSCRHCSLKFPNVGEMRRHLLVAHKEDWLLNRKTSPKKEATEKVKKKVSKKKKVPVKVVSKLDYRDLSVDSNLSHPDLDDSIFFTPKEPTKVLSSPVSKKKVQSTCFVNGQAPNGYKSNLRYSCFTCKKRFISYYALANHRRLNHPYNIYAASSLLLHMKQKMSEELNPITSLPMLAPPELPSFDPKLIQDNVSENLLNFTDGKADALNSFRKHIQIHGYKSINSVSPVKSEKFVWTLYNFPFHYSPYESVIGYSSCNQLPIVGEGIGATSIRNTSGLRELKIDINGEAAPILPCMTSPQRRSSNDSDSKSMPSLSPLALTEPQFTEYHTAEKNCPSTSLNHDKTPMSTNTNSSAFNNTCSSGSPELQCGDSKSFVPFLASLNLVSASKSEEITKSMLEANNATPANKFQNEMHQTLKKLSWDYNFDEALFGKLGDVINVCSVCMRYFETEEAVVRHQWTRHSSIICRYLQMEKGHDIDNLFYPWVSNEGMVASSTPVPEDCHLLDSYRCTYCKCNFKSISRLHVHIISCDPQKVFYVEKLSVKERRKQEAKERKAREKENSSNMPNREMNKKQSKILKNKFDNRRKKNKLKKLVKVNQSSKSPVRGEKNSPIKEEVVSERSLRTFRRNEVDLFTNSDSRVTRLRKRRNYKLLYKSKKPSNQRETSLDLDSFQCERCAAQFRTQFLLGKHVPYCNERSKLKNEESHSGQESETTSAGKACHYCKKPFTYIKSLKNHQRICAMRRNQVSSTIQATDNEKENVDIPSDVANAGLIKQNCGQSEVKQHCDTGSEKFQGTNKQIANLKTQLTPDKSDVAETTLDLKSKFCENDENNIDDTDTDNPESIHLDSNQNVPVESMLSIKELNLEIVHDFHLQKIQQLSSSCQEMETSLNQNANLSAESCELNNIPEVLPQPIANPSDTKLASDTLSTFSEIECTSKDKHVENNCVSKDLLTPFDGACNSSISINENIFSSKVTQCVSNNLTITNSLKLESETDVENTSRIAQNTIDTENLNINKDANSLFVLNKREAKHISPLKIQCGNGLNNSVSDISSCDRDNASSKCDFVTDDLQSDLNSEIMYNLDTETDSDSHYYNDETNSSDTSEISGLNGRQEKNKIILSDTTQFPNSNNNFPKVNSYKEIKTVDTEKPQLSTSSGLIENCYESCNVSPDSDVSR